MARDEVKQVLRKHEWYLRNKQYVTKQAHERTKEIQTWFRSYKSTLSCSSCEESHPACLDFHHVEQETKLVEVSRMVKNGYPVDRIIAEIDKCIVLCANCHRKQHWPP